MSDINTFPDPSGDNPSHEKIKEIIGRAMSDPNVNFNGMFSMIKESLERKDFSKNEYLDKIFADIENAIDCMSKLSTENIKYLISLTSKSKYPATQLFIGMFLSTKLSSHQLKNS